MIYPLEVVHGLSDSINNDIKYARQKILDIYEGVKEIKCNIKQIVDGVEITEFNVEQMAIQIGNNNILAALDKYKDLSFSALNNFAINNINNIGFVGNTNSFFISDFSKLSMFIENGLDWSNTGGFNINGSEINSKITFDESNFVFGEGTIIDKDTVSVIENISFIGEFTTNSCLLNTGSFNISNVGMYFTNFPVNSMIGNGSFIGLGNISFEDTMSKFSNNNIQNIYGNIYLSNQLQNTFNEKLGSKFNLSGIGKEFLYDIGLDTGIVSSLILSNNIVDKNLYSELLAEDINKAKEHLKLKVKNGEISEEQMKEMLVHINKVGNSAIGTINGLISKVNGLSKDTFTSDTIMINSSITANELEQMISNNNVNLESNGLSRNLNKVFNSVNIQNAFTSMGLGMMGITMTKLGANGSSINSNLTNSSDEKLDLINKLCDLFKGTTEPMIMLLLRNSFYNRVILNKNKDAFVLLKKFILIKEHNPNLRIINTRKQSSKLDIKTMSIGISEMDLKLSNENVLFNEIGKLGFNVVLNRQRPQNWDIIINKIKDNRNNYYSLEELSSFDTIIGDFTNLKSSGSKESMETLTKLKKYYGNNFYNTLDKTYYDIFK